jgi:hypothetical protein
MKLKLSDGKYTAKSCNMCGIKSAVVTFCNSCDVSLCYISADGKPIGVGALSSNYNNKSDMAQFPIDEFCGTADIELTVDGQAKILDLEFSPEPCRKANYTPTPESSFRDTKSDTWEATDMLGRKVASVEDVGAKRDKKVGIFYWTWHEEHSHLRPVNVVKTLDKFPAAEYRKDHPAWGEGEFQCFWNEPLYGFYKDSDPYVIRHHISMLSAAGIDFLMFDCTNGALVWRAAYEALLLEMHKMRQDGIRTPQVAFMLNFGPAKSGEKMLRALYQNLYKPGLYSDLWFTLGGKPVMMGYSDALPEKGFCKGDDKLLNEIREFFAFRPGQPMYDGGTYKSNQWGWLEKFPQNKYRIRPDGSCEQMTVGVAQNCSAERICTHFNDKGTFGRSYTHKFGHSMLSPDSYKYGYNFQEQWDRVIDISPDIAFVTGWNEWIMGQWHEPWLSDNDSTQLAMVDQYNREYSRDIEPDIDGYLDTYYLQLVSNIRRFKGASQRDKTSGEKTINIRAGARQWKDVTPEYINDKGTTIHRDYDGFGDYHYTNTSGRNNIICTKVARDNEFLYFSAKCADKITEPESPGWMTLFIDADRNKKSGWEGYDFCINRLMPRRGKASVERYQKTADKGSFTWEQIGFAEISKKGDFLQLKIPRELLGMTDSLNFEFKWSDNMQSHSVMDFYVNGDAAPLGRFNYLYKE